MIWHQNLAVGANPFYLNIQNVVPPKQLLKINFFLTPDCKYHQLFNINASKLLQILVEY